MALTFTPGAGVVYMRDGAREITLLPQQVEQLLDIWEAADAHPWFNDLYEAGQRADAALPRVISFRTVEKPWPAVPDAA